MQAGKRITTYFVKHMCSILGMDDSKYTSHAFRRSAATNLADGGVSFVNLKRHGQWKSDSVAESYIANSRVLRAERELLLLPEKLRAPYASAKQLVVPPPGPEMGQTGLSMSQLSHHTFKLLTPGPTQPDDHEDSTDDSDDEPIITLVKKSRKKPVSSKKSKLGESKKDAAALPIQPITSNSQQKNDIELVDLVDQEEDFVILPMADRIPSHTVVSNPSSATSESVPGGGTNSSGIRKLVEDAKAAVFNNCTFYFK